jgi:uncharacterized protein (TIGR02246 family)
MKEEARIRAVIEDWSEAVRARDVNRSMSHYALDVLMFDVVDPLQYVGSDAMRKRAEEWFSSFQGAIGYELRDLNIAAGDGVAFTHSLNHVSGTKMDGTRLDMWWRATVCFRKMEGEWMATHAHNSVPFNVTNGKPSLELKP